MQRVSWILLGIALLAVLCLGMVYVFSSREPATLTEDRAVAMVHKMQHAFAMKDVGAIMDTIAPGNDIRVAHLSRGQLRGLLARAFQAMRDPEADVSNIALAVAGDQATLGFDLVVHDKSPQLDSIPYTGHITLNLQHVPISHLFGLYRTEEWRIVGGSTTGPDPSNYGGYD